jgi:hypothetical protein
MKKNSLATIVGVGVLLAITGGVNNASAVNLDLTTAGSSGTINGARFFQADPRPTGTGYIDPFVRINPGGNQSPEEGFNADARPVMPDVNTSPNYTRDLQIGELAIIKLNGTDYYKFLLDVNQTGTDPLISLDRLEIWIKDSPLTSADSYSDLATPGDTPEYSLDNGGNNSVILNYNLNSGSGSGDLFVYVPVSKLGTDASDYVYLFSHFGDTHNSNDGFEEWAAALKQPVRVADASSTMMLLGMALMAVEGLRRRFSK